MADLLSGNRRVQILAAVIVAVFSFAIFRLKSYLDLPDFKVFYHAASLALSQPELLYRDSPLIYLYSPPAALFFVPFQIFDWEVAKLVWSALNALVLFWFASRSKAHLIAAVILGRYWMMNLQFGQINLMVLASMILIDRFSQRGQLGPAAPLLALGSVVKVFPAVQGILMLHKRDYKSLAMTFGWIAIFCSLPFFFWGLDTTTQLFLEFPAQLHQNGIRTYSHNQSITIFLMRFFGGLTFDLFGIKMVNWAVLDLPHGFLKVLGLLFGALLSGFAWVLAFRRGLPGDTLSAACFTILFLSYLVWKTYFIFLFPPLVQILNQPHPWNPKKRPFLWLFLILGPLSTPDFIGHFPSVAADGFCIHLFAALAVLMAWARRASVAS